MSMVLINPSSPDRVHYTHLFARIVRERRLELGLSTARAAELAGLTTSQWCSLEEGWVPTEHKQIRPIAEALELRNSDLEVVSLLSSLAQDTSLQ
jgi:predicted transcriptional regulator